MPRKTADIEGLIEALQEIWDVNQAGRFVKRSPGAVRNLVMRKKIPYRKVAGRLVFLRTELEKWVMEAPGLSLEELKRQK